MVTLSVGHRMCDSQIVRSSSGQAPPHSGLRQTTYTSGPLSLSSVVLYWPRDSDAYWLGLLESDGGIVLGL